MVSVAGGTANSLGGPDLGVQTEGSLIEQTLKSTKEGFNMTRSFVHSLLTDHSRPRASPNSPLRCSSF